jgi:acetyl esterase/lipase
MVHGGGWARGDKLLQGVWQDKARHWTGQGWIFISTNYRMIPQANPLEQARDVARALAKVQQMAPSWGADPHGVILMGHSAGAHLVALLTAKPQWAYEQGAQAWKASISLDSGAMDVAAIMNRQHFRLYDQAFGQDPAFWTQVSPLQQISGPIVPLLAVCSSRRQDSCPEAHQFADRAAHFGSHVQVLPEDLSHAEINHELGADNDYTHSVDAFIAGL